MRNVLVVVLIVLAGAAGYFFMAPTPPPVQPVTVTEPDELSKQAAKRHIETITQTPEDSIRITEADHFVNKDQLLQLPVQQTETAAGTEAISSETATSFAVELNSFANRSSGPSTSAQGIASAQGQILRSDELPQNQQIRLKELLNDPDTAADTLFYVHGVTAGDDQGLWGIIQQGLMQTFARGIEMQQGTVSADIPRSADERLSNSTSSFLGTILDRKVKDTYVYNYQKGILGQNPDLINPGQEVIIVTFTEAELISIYEHFTKSNSAH